MVVKELLALRKAFPLEGWKGMMQEETEEGVEDEEGVLVE